MIHNNSEILSFHLYSHQKPTKKQICGLEIGDQYKIFIVLTKDRQIKNVNYFNLVMVACVRLYKTNKCNPLIQFSLGPFMSLTIKPTAF